MTDVPNRIAYWLLPADSDEKALQTLIDCLAERFDTPRFAPHLTLVIRPETSLAKLKTILESLRQAPALQLQVANRLRWSRQYNRALIQPFALNQPLADLVCRLAADHRLPADYDPHLSLLYGNLDKQTGRQLCREERLPMQTITFDRVAAIAIGPQTRSADDVAAWQTLATIPLKK